MTTLPNRLSPQTASAIERPQPALCPESAIPFTSAESMEENRLEAVRAVIAAPRRTPVNCHHGTPGCAYGAEKHGWCQGEAIAFTAPGYQGREHVVLEVLFDGNDDADNPRLMLAFCAAGGDCTYLTPRELRDLAFRVHQHADQMAAMADRFEILGGAR